MSPTAALAVDEMSDTSVDYDESGTGNLETVVPVTIGILATIFVGAMVALIVVCRRRYCKPPDYLARQYAEYR
jgi:hypothetical protein